MRDIPNDIITAFESAQFTTLILVEIEFPTPIRFCSAYTAVTIDGTQYIGGGSLGSVSTIRENTDLDPQELDITLAGIEDATLNAVATSDYLNQDVTVKLAMLNDQGQVIGGQTMLYFFGKTDQVSFDFGSKSAITVAARNRLADWSRPRVERNLNSDQQAKYPGDKGFEFVAQVAEADIVWPAGEFFQ